MRGGSSAASPAGCAAVRCRRAARVRPADQPGERGQIGGRGGPAPGGHRRRRVGWTEPAVPVVAVARVHAVPGRGERDGDEQGREQPERGIHAVKHAPDRPGPVQPITQEWTAWPVDDIDRRIGAHSFARLLGDWRPPGGRGLTAALADRVRLLVLDGRLPLQTRVPAERELATVLDVSRTTIAAAYETLREAGILNSRRGAGSWTQVPPGTVGSGMSSPFSPHGDRALFDLAAALPAPAAELRAAAALAVERPRRAPGRARLRPARPPGAARGGRTTVHRARPADHGGPGAGHLRRPGRDRARARGPRHARRPGARRAPDLPERARRRARPRRAVRPGARSTSTLPARTRGTWTW